jgi:hypothetical protein
MYVCIVYFFLLAQNKIRKKKRNFIFISHLFHIYLKKNNTIKYKRYIYLTRLTRLTPTYTDLHILHILHISYQHVKGLILSFPIKASGLLITKSVPRTPTPEIKVSL